MKEDPLEEGGGKREEGRNLLKGKGEEGRKGGQWFRLHQNVVILNDTT